MEVRGLERLICEHRFFAGMAPEYCELIGGCARNVRFDKGAYLFREGEPADEFFLIRLDLREPPACHHQALGAPKRARRFR
jgi:hypothetical protein